MRCNYETGLNNELQLQAIHPTPVLTLSIGGKPHVFETKGTVQCASFDATTTVIPHTQTMSFTRGGRG